MRTASEHADLIRAAIRAAEADGYLVESDDDGSNCCRAKVYMLEIWHPGDYRGTVQTIKENG